MKKKIMQPPKDWSSLPSGILETISTRVSSDADYVRFRSVCTSWRSAAPKRVFLLPWLIVRKYSPVGDNGGDRSDDSSSLRLSNYPNTTDPLTPQLPEGVARGKYIFGSSLGWIGLLDEEDVSLYNPCTGRHVRLPPLPDLPPEFTWYNTIRRSGQDFVVECDVDDSPRVMKPFHYFRAFLAVRLVLSSDPVAAPDDCVVMTTFFGEQMLIYCCPGDTSWTPLKLPVEIFFIPPPNSYPLDLPQNQTEFRDIIFYQGKFYAVSENRLFVCHTGTDARVTEILPADPLFINDEAQRQDDDIGSSRIYEIESFLVVSSGDLLLAKILQGRPLSCEVFRVDFLGGERLRLVKLENLGGRALFLGGRSMSLSAANSPRFKENRVYYLDQNHVKSPGDNTGHIYRDVITAINLEDGSTSSIPSPSDEVEDTHWLTPSLC